jgi:hypothetical protein
MWRGEQDQKYYLAGDEDQQHEEGGENHELPRGALLLTLSFLALLVLLWMQVYLQLLMSGGIAQ